MKVATWNINSIRIRLENLRKLQVEHGIDILLLQETKVEDKDFPVDKIKEIGFEHIFFSGEKSYNGVAILSKIPLYNMQKIVHGTREDARHLMVSTEGGIEIHNFYVPAGGDEPDVKINPKFAHKLNYMDDMTKWFKQNRKSTDKIIIMGDLNIAPQEHDVWSHKQLLTVVSHTPIEVEKIQNLQNSIDFVDISRANVPASEKLYSWWSYRNRDWKKSNRGRRLDHIWATKIVSENLKNTYILREARDWISPSDHVPVIAEFSMP